MKGKRKGQGALEYLMTYGWALLIIVVVGAALFALGVFSPQTREACTGFSYFTYQNHVLYINGTAAVTIVNGNQDITITAMTWDAAGSLGTPTTQQSAGTQFTARLNSAASGTSGNSYSDTLIITYTGGGITGKVDRATCTGKYA